MPLPTDRPEFGMSMEDFALIISQVTGNVASIVQHLVRIIACLSKACMYAWIEIRSVSSHVAEVMTMQYY